MFKKAERKQAKLRLAICGPSGSGKTLSALLIARGLAPEDRIAVIDTERGSAELYGHLYEYDVAPITPPFSPQKYVGFIKEAEAAGYAAVIIDSLSHAWAGEGGILEFVDKVAAASPKKDNFSAWRRATPEHNALVDAMLGSRCHIIATLRTKTAYEIVEDANGKKRPVKVGLAPLQRDGLEYEFTLVLDLSIEGHVATASKDRTGLFDGEYWVPTEATGRTLRAWLDGGSPERLVETVPATIHVSEAAKERIVKIVSRAARARAWLQAEALLEKEFAGDPETLAYARDQVQRAKQLSETPVVTAA